MHLQNDEYSRLSLSHYRGFTYYKMSNLDNRISNADQLLTQDVEKFCDSVVELYSNISKPILDILIYVQKLTQAIGGQVGFCTYWQSMHNGMMYFFYWNSYQRKLQCCNFVQYHYIVFIQYITLFLIHPLRPQVS